MKYRGKKEQKFIGDMSAMKNKLPIISFFIGMIVVALFVVIVGVIDQSPKTSKGSIFCDQTITNLSSLEKSIKSSGISVTLILSDDKGYLKCANGLAFFRDDGTIRAYHSNNVDIPLDSVLFSFNQTWLFLPGYTYKR